MVCLETGGSVSSHCLQLLVVLCFVTSALGSPFPPESSDCPFFDPHYESLTQGLPPGSFLYSVVLNLITLTQASGGPRIPGSYSFHQELNFLQIPTPDVHVYLVALLPRPVYMLGLSSAQNLPTKECIRLACSPGCQPTSP